MPEDTHSSGVDLRTCAKRVDGRERVPKIGLRIGRACIPATAAAAALVEPQRRDHGSRESIGDTPE